MHYVLDTGFFVVARYYYRATFPSFWVKLSEAANENIISSADEVRDEVENYGGAQEHLVSWIKENKPIFEPLDDAEQEKLRQVMSLFPQALSKSKQSGGGPWADPLVIARALNLNATVVTGEKSAKDKKGHVPSLVKIPDICDKLKVRWINPEGFLREMGWSF